jgi:short-subunit dehydrogenase
MAMKKKTYALVTGATSGIGYELAKQAAQDGYNLVLVSRDGDELVKVKNELAVHGVDIRLIPRNLFTRDAAFEIYAITKAQELEVEILINNAGQGQYGKFAHEDLDRHTDIIQLNITSLVVLTHLYLNDMIRAGRGRILQVGSEVSKIPGPLFAVYAATKAFVASFTEALINELHDTGVTMTLLMPGATDTDFFDKADMEDTKIYREGILDAPEVVAEQAFAALKNGDRRIIGPAGKRNVAMAAITPDNLLAKNLRSKMEPSDKDADDTRQMPEHARSREVKEKGREE